MENEAFDVRLGAVESLINIYIKGKKKKKEAFPVRLGAVESLIKNKNKKRIKKRSISGQTGSG